MPLCLGGQRSQLLDDLLHGLDARIILGLFLGTEVLHHVVQGTLDSVDAHDARQAEAAIFVRNPHADRQDLLLIANHRLNDHYDCLGNAKRRVTFLLDDAICLACRLLGLVGKVDALHLLALLQRHAAHRGQRHGWELRVAVLTEDEQVHRRRADSDSVRQRCAEPAGVQHRAGAEDLPQRQTCAFLRHKGKCVTGVRHHDDLC
mmetsp:Transcript_75967/g.150254  ORF Transcript_75967/g.150254 Transcript_75967/m.150254 type:complete len:204 (-) Transcript_75967:131-742(-)